MYYSHLKFLVFNYDLKSNSCPLTFEYSHYKSKIIPLFE